MLYGYARVSTLDQSLDGQIAELKAAGCVRVYSERVSGASRRNRKELTKVMNKLTADDVLVITRLDRLARSTRDLLNLIDDVKQRKAGFKSLGDTWADTTTAHGQLMLTVIGGIAEFERSLIIKRTTEGRERAVAKGVKFGRKPKLTPHQQKEALARKEAGEPIMDIARSYNIHYSRISRLRNGDAHA